MLDGFGAFVPPPPTARPTPAGFTARATLDHPPGFYGPPEGLLAVNALAPADRLAPLDVSPLNARIEGYRVSEPQDLRGAMMLGALTLLALDALVVFWMAGGIASLSRKQRRAGAAAAVALAVLGASVLAAPQAWAQQPRPSAPAAADDAVKATLETRLAYIVTGDAEVDRISKAGLQGLTLFLAQRTALEAGEPVGARSGARRTSVLSAHLLAGGAGRRQARRARRWNTSTPT